jgi:hypothetical protein
MSPANSKFRMHGEARSWLPRWFAFGLLLFLLAGRTADEQQTALTGAWQMWQ